MHDIPSGISLATLRIPKPRVPTPRDVASLQVAYTLLTGNFPAGAATHPALWATLPLVFGIMTFCYSGHGVFPSIQASMKHPEQFPKVRCRAVGNQGDVISWVLWVQARVHRMGLGLGVRKASDREEGCSLAGLGGRL